MKERRRYTKYQEKQQKKRKESRAMQQRIRETERMIRELRLTISKTGDQIRSREELTDTHELLLMGIAQKVKELETRLQRMEKENRNHKNQLRRRNSGKKKWEERCPRVNLEKVGMREPENRSPFQGL